MPSVLLTAFAPYDRWNENSSWLTLLELTKDMPSSPTVTTRLYPVDFALLRESLQRDLAADYDFVLHLGQSPGSGAIRLEAVGLNVAGPIGPLSEDLQPLVIGGPVAYRSQLPLGHWSNRLRQAGIPAQVSFHAGTYLCNAALYLTHYFSEQRHWKTRAAFIHLPLAPSQVLDQHREEPTLPTAMTAAAVKLILSAIDGDPLA